MKSIATFLYIESLPLERTILETVKNFRELEIVESVSDQFTFLERIGVHNPDIVFIEFKDRTDHQLEVFEMIPKPIFSIAVCEENHQIQKFLDKGFFDVLTGEITKELLTKKIYKMLKFSNDILERFYMKPIVSTPKIDYHPKIYEQQIPKETIYLKHKTIRVKVYIDEIIFIENVKETILVVTDSGRKYFHLGSLKKLVESLPKNKIIRINNTIAIHYQKVDKIQNQIVYIGDHKFKVSRLYITKLKEALKIRPQN